MSSLSDYNNFVRANLPNGMEFNSNTNRYVVNNRRFFSYIIANWYLQYLIKTEGYSVSPLVINGLVNGVAEIGSHASITAGVTEGTLSSPRWGSTQGGSEYGTLASPGPFTEGVLYLTADVDGETYTTSSNALYPFPDQFANNQWDFLNLPAIGDMLLSWSDRPDDNGGDSLGLIYRVDGGTVNPISSNATLGSVTLSGFNTGDSPDLEIASVNSRGVGPWSAVKTAMKSSIPNWFTNSMWSIVGTGVSGQAQITINSLPSGNGNPLTAIQYRVDGTSWVELTATPSASVFTINGLTDNEILSVEIRAVNSLGNSDPSDTKTVETSAPAVGGLPFGFAPNYWSLQDSGQSQQLEVQILELPADNGSPITDIEYDVDRDNNWISLGENTLGTFTLPSTLDNDQDYQIRLRSVNAIGASAQSSIKVATPTNSAVIPGQLGVNDWSLTNLETGGDARIVIVNTVSGTVTDYEYSLDGGALFTSLGVSSAATVDLSVFTDDVLTPVILRAVNTFGEGPNSDTKEITTTNATATVPFGFLSENWAITDNQTGGDADISINALPTNGGSVILGIQYQLQVNNVNQAIVNLPISGVGTYTLTDAFVDGQATRIRIRPYNAIGPASDANWGVRKDITTTNSAPAPGGVISASGVTFDGADLIVSDAEASGTTGNFDAIIVSHPGGTSVTATEILSGVGGNIVEVVNVPASPTLDGLDTTGLEFVTPITGGEVSVLIFDEDSAQFVGRATPLGGLTVAEPSSGVLSAGHVAFAATHWEARNGAVANGGGTATLDLTGGPGAWDLRMLFVNGDAPDYDPTGATDYNITFDIANPSGHSTDHVIRVKLDATAANGSSIQIIGQVDVTLTGAASQSVNVTIPGIVAAGTFVVSRIAIHGADGATGDTVTLSNIQMTEV